MLTNDELLDPKRKLMEALLPGGTAVDPFAGGGAPEVGGMETMPTSTTDPVALSPSAPSAPAYAFKDKLRGFDMGKFDNASHMSPKYQVGRTLAGFDPTQGITPEVLAALNKLNLGTFSGSGDKVSLANGDPKWDGMTGADLIQDYGPGGQNNWTLQGEFPGQPQGGGGATGGGNAPLGGVPLDALLSGDPMAKIQAMLAQLSGPRSNAQALLAALSGGQ